MDREIIKLIDDAVKKNEDYEEGWHTCDCCDGYELMDNVFGLLKQIKKILKEKETPSEQ